MLYIVVTDLVYFSFEKNLFSVEGKLFSDKVHDLSFVSFRQEKFPIIFLAFLVLFPYYEDFRLNVGPKV